MHLRNSLIHHVEAIVLTNWRGDIGDPYPVIVRSWDLRTDSVPYQEKRGSVSMCNFLCVLWFNGLKRNRFYHPVHASNWPKWGLVLSNRNTERMLWVEFVGLNLAQAPPHKLIGALKVETHTWLLIPEDLWNQYWKIHDFWKTKWKHHIFPEFLERNPALLSEKKNVCPPVPTLHINGSHSAVVVTGINQAL